MKSKKKFDWIVAFDYDKLWPPYSAFWYDVCWKMAYGRAKGKYWYPRIKILFVAERFSKAQGNAKLVPNHEFIYTGKADKRKFLKDQGRHVDIWIQ